MRCPVCKADNPQGPQCRRCKADLWLLFAIEEQRQQALSATRQCLAGGQWGPAVQHAEAADWMRSDEESQRLLAVAYLLNRDFVRAWQSYQIIGRL